LRLLTIYPQKDWQTLKNFDYPKEKAADSQKSCLPLYYNAFSYRFCVER
jgi:hypothetical protein